MYTEVRFFEFCGWPIVLRCCKRSIISPFLSTVNFPNYSEYNLLSQAGT